jgi:hypothetical protein
MLLAPSHPLAAAEAAITAPIGVLGGWNLLQLGLAGLLVGAAVYFGVKGVRSATKKLLGGVI